MLRGCIPFIQNFKQKRTIIMGLVYFIGAVGVGVLIVGIYVAVKYRDLLFKH